MKDYGTRKTDLAVKRTEWRLSRVYHQAERDIEDKLKDWQKGHAAREAKYRQMVKDGKMSQKDFDAWMRGQVFQEKQWKARQEQIRQVLLNADREAARIVNKGKLGVFADNANYTNYEVEQVTGIDTGYTLYNEETVARLIEGDPQILPKAAKGVKKDKAFSYYNKLMNSAITQGIIQGETIQQIAKRIAETTGESSYKSAVRNARTAYGGAQNAGCMESMRNAKSMGINVKKRWMAILDGKTRDAHADLDGQIQELDDPFVSELGEIMYPLDPTADPANVYNCRCRMVRVFPDYPSDIQRRDAETGEIVGDVTYREWEEMKGNGNDGKLIDDEEVAQKIKALPDHEWGGGTKINQLPLADDEIVKESAKIHNSLKREKKLGLDKYEVREVPISKLETRQTWIESDKLLDQLNEAILKGTINGDAGSESIRALEYKGHLIVIDGNHRVNLALLRGQKRIKMRILKLNNG